MDKSQPGGVTERSKPSVSEERTWVSVRQSISRLFAAIVSARAGPLFLIDLALSTPSAIGPGFSKTSPLSNRTCSKFTHFQHGSLEYLTCKTLI